MYVCIGKNTVNIELSAICGFKHPQGSWNITSADKGGPLYLEISI